MTIHFINGPIIGEIDHPALKPGSTITLIISANPDLYGKADQHDSPIRAAYRITNGGKAVECDRPEIAAGSTNLSDRLAAIYKRAERGITAEIIKATAP